MDLTLGEEDLAFATEVREWLSSHLGDVPVFSDVAEEVEWGRRWQALMAADRWVGIHWPAEFGGRDATPVQVALYQSECARARAPQPVNRVGINLVGPTLLAHGTPEQCARWMPAILSADEIWCQLFSEPGAGSDLGSLSTRAEAVDGGYRLHGQKVWTSYAGFADWGLCLARTGPVGTPGAGAISAMAVGMHDGGVEVRPLTQITGDAEFSEVFLDGVFVPHDQLIGVEGAGWAVAGSTLAHERGTNFPLKEEAVHEAYFLSIFHEASASGALDNPIVADALADTWVKLNVLKLHNWRMLTRLGRGEEPGPESSWIKLSWTDMTQTLSEVTLIVGGGATRRERAPGGASGRGTPIGRGNESGLAGWWARQWLWSRAASIAGGTSQVQRDIIAVRILGLPR